MIAVPVPSALLEGQEENWFRRWLDECYASEEKLASKLTVGRELIFEAHCT